MKGLGYGDSGIGKTTLIATMPDPIIISAEKGLLSLSHVDIPVIEVRTLAEITDAYKWVKSSTEAEQYQSVAVDSISDVAEVLLANYKKGMKDGRMAYGKMGDDVAEMIRRFRDLDDKNVYIIAKIKRQVDELTGMVTFVPSIPGQTMLQNLPFFFDLVFVMRYAKGKDGKKGRFIQTEGDAQYIAKDRSNRLDQMESPDLGQVISKMKGE